MKSRIIADSFAWLVCFLTLALYLPSTRWWATERYPQDLNFETLLVATLGAIAWVSLRAFSRRSEIQSHWERLLGIALILPVAAWAIGYVAAWSIFSSLVGLPFIGRLLFSGQPPSFAYVPRVFTLMPLIVAGYGWGLASALIFDVRNGERLRAQSN